MPDTSAQGAEKTPKRGGRRIKAHQHVLPMTERVWACWCARFCLIGFALGQNPSLLALGSVMERSGLKGKYDRLKPIRNLFCSELLQKPHRGLDKALGIVFVLFG